MSPPPAGSGNQQQQQQQKNLGRCPEWTDGNFEDFCFLFENYVALNKIDTEDVVRMLVSAMGAKALKIKKLLGGDITKWTLVKTKEAGQKLFGTIVNKYAAREKLNNRVQQEGESVADYAVALQSLAEGCEYLEADNQDNILKGRFLAGLRSKEFKLQLYSSADVKPFVEVVDAALLLETLHKSVETPKVNKIKQFGKGNFKRQDKVMHQGVKERKGGDSRQRRCFNCNKEGHIKADCRRCYRCKMMGHKSYDCKNQAVIKNMETKDPKEESSKFNQYLTNI